jgi:heme-degrading monooxygenase HmoA
MCDQRNLEEPFASTSREGMASAVPLGFEAMWALAPEVTPMIARLWHGWTTPANADAYEALLRTKILPGIHRVQGHEGAYLMRRDSGNEVEFVTLTFFTSMDAVRAFAGPDHEVAVVPPEARELLSRFDHRAVHYESIVRPG